MKKINVNLIVLTLLSTVLIVPSYAGPYEYLQSTLENNLDLQQALKQKEILEQSLIVAEARRKPQLSGSGSLQIDEPDGMNAKRLNAQVIARQELFNLGNREAVEVAKLQLEKTNLNIQNIRQRLMNATYQAYINASLAKENLSVLDQRESNLQEQLKIANLNFDVGNANQIQVLNIQAQLAALDAERISLNNTLADAIANLEHVSKKPATEITNLSFDADVFETDLEYWIAKIKDAPDVKIAQIDIDIQYATTKQLESSILPSAELQAILNQDFDTRFNINLAVPIYSSGGATAAKRQSELTAITREQTYTSLIDSKELAVEVALRNFTQQDALAKAINIRVDVEKERLKIAQTNIEFVAGIFADALNAATDLATAELQLTQARHAQFRAYLNLIATTGDMTLDTAEELEVLFNE